MHVRIKSKVVGSPIKSKQKGVDEPTAMPKGTNLNKNHWFCVIRKGQIIFIELKIEGEILGRKSFVLICYWSLQVFVMGWNSSFCNCALNQEVLPLSVMSKSLPFDAVSNNINEFKQYFQMNFERAYLCKIKWVAINEKSCTNILYAITEIEDQKNLTLSTDMHDLVTFCTSR